jgi:uncharacterized protein
MEPLEIKYPIRWAYSMIGFDENDMRAAAKFAVGEKEHTITKSNRSSGGKYISIKLDLIVDDEAERLAIFDLLKHDKAVKILL